MARKRCLNRALYNLPGVDGNFGSNGLHVIKVNGAPLKQVTQGKVLKYLQQGDLVTLETWDKTDGMQNEVKLIRVLKLNKDIVKGKSEKIVRNYREESLTNKKEQFSSSGASDLEILQKIQENYESAGLHTGAKEQSATIDTRSHLIDLSQDEESLENKIKTIFKKIVTKLNVNI